MSVVRSSSWERISRWTLARLENREASLDVWLRIGIANKEALHEKEPNPKGYAGLNANAGLEVPPDHLRRL